MKNFAKCILCFTIIILWADMADAQINLQRRYRHHKHKNIYLQDDSKSDSESSIAAGIYGSGLYFLSSGSQLPIIFGGAFRGSYQFTSKSYFDMGFSYMLPATNSVNSSSGVTYDQTLSGFEILFLGGYDIVGGIDDDFSFGIIGGGSLLFLDHKVMDFTVSFQQYFINAGLTTGIKIGPGQIKFDAIFALPANTVNNQAVEVQTNAAYLKASLGYKISF